MKYLTTKDAEEWRSYINRLPEEVKDIHFYPEMMLPYEAIGLGTGLLAVEENCDGFLVQPLLHMIDNVTRHPYNFGGPISTPGFRSSVIIDCQCILNPFLAEKQNELLGCQATLDKYAVWVDLTKDLKLRPTTRHEIEKSPVYVDWFFPTEKNIEAFADMYRMAMARLGAAPHWHFPNKWFQKLFEVLLTDNSLGGDATLLLGYYDDKPVAGCVIIHRHGTAYYHFAAHNLALPIKGMNHKLLHEAILWAKEAGLKRFHIGGGLRNNDGLFKFKSGFSRARLPVYRFNSHGSGVKVCQDVSSSLKLA